MHYYKRNIGDYAKKAGRLSMLQHGAYTLILDSCYDREQFPNRDQAIEWAWASSKEEIEAVDFVLSRFFILENDGTYTQTRVLEELLEYAKFCDLQAEKGKRGGRPSKPSGLKNKPAGILNEPNGSPDESHCKAEESLTTNQEPLTKNHKPLTTNQLKTSDANASVCVDASQSSPPAKRVAKPKEEPKGVQTWVAYSNAYYSRYGVDPVRNAKTNSMIAQLVDRLGEEDAPHVAAFYIHHSNSFYVANGHSVGMLLRDAEKLRTEWATGRKVTQTMARQVDRTASNAFANMLTAQEQGNDRK